jgi:hypothetical protein
VAAAAAAAAAVASSSREPQSGRCRAMAFLAASTGGKGGGVSEQSDELERALKDVFQRIDEDGGGSLDKEELLHCFESLDITLNTAELNAVFDDIDDDGGGEIEFEEFASWMMGVHPLASALRHGLEGATGGKDLSELLTDDDIEQMAKERRKSGGFINVVKGDLGQTIFLLMDEPHSSQLARIISLWIQLLIFVSTLIFLCETLQEVRKPGNGYILDWFHTAEWICVGHFTLEYCLRVATCTRRPYVDKGIWSYVSQPLNVVDICAILPGYIEAFFGVGAGSFAVLRILRLARIFRIIKMGSANQNLNIVFDGLNQSRNGLLLMVYLVLIFMVVMSSIMYMIEGGGTCNPDFDGTMEAGSRGVCSGLDNLTCGNTAGCVVWDREVAYTVGDTVSVTPAGHCGLTQAAVDTCAENAYESSSVCEAGGYCVYKARTFEHIPATFWFTIVTMTSVGYGDMFPETDPGRFVASFIMLSGILTLAVPITLIGNKFHHVWVKEKQRRHKLARMKMMQQQQRLDGTPEGLAAQTVASDKALDSRILTATLMLEASSRCGMHAYTVYRTWPADHLFCVAVQRHKGSAIQAGGELFEECAGKRTPGRGTGN